MEVVEELEEVVEEVEDTDLLTRQTRRATQGAESVLAPPFCSTELSLSSHKKGSIYSTASRPAPTT